MNDLADRSFASTFDFEALDELPGGPAPGVRYYPGDRATGQDGLLVRVSPRVGESWLGMFAFGEIGRIGASRILTMPAPDRLCVVARGAGYIVNAERPEEWETVKSVPILDVRAAPSAGVVVFADYTNICAYSRSGHAWLSTTASITSATRRGKAAVVIGAVARSDDVGGDRVGGTLGNAEARC